MRTTAKKRADLLLVELGLAESREKAQALVLAGQVYLGDRRIEKAGERLLEASPLVVKQLARFVSRGGDKLESALAELTLTVAGRVVLDIGASTGGFTDCVLQRGAARVYAVDVGHGLLHPKVASDPRVVVMDGTNARHLTAEMFDPPPTLCLVDASFISLAKLAPAAHAVLAPGGELVALVKPQFEVGRELAARHRGVIRDAELRRAAIDRTLAAIESAGFRLRARSESRVKGPKGNIEEFVWAEKLGG